MRRLFDVDDRTQTPGEANATQGERPKSLARIKVERSPLERVRLLVEDAYARARERDCCDPRDLAEGLGLVPCPARVKLPVVKNDTLYYPETAPIDVRGVGIYYELALLLSPRLVMQVMDELILPTRTAKRVLLPDLEHVQPNAPYTRVLTIFMRHGHHSGQWPALR